MAHRPLASPEPVHDALYVSIAAAAAGRSELRRADHSAAALIAVLTSTTALVGGVDSPVPTLWSLGLWGALFAVVLASALVTGTVAAGWLFISAVSTCPGPWPTTPEREAFGDELWRLSLHANATAAAKYRKIRRGVPWLGLAAGVAFLWSLLGTLTG